MSIFNFKKKDLVAVIDISDFAVTGCLINIQKDATPEIVFNCKKEIPFQDHFSFKRLFYAVSRSILSVSEAIHSSGMGRPGRILCVLGPHLYMSQTRIVKAKYDKPIIVTKKIIDDIVSSDLQDFYLKGEFKEFIDRSSSNTVLEKNNMKIRVNGYESADPFGKEASEIEVSVFISVTSNGFLSDIRRIISSVFHNDEIYFGTFSFSIFNATRDCFSKNEDFIVFEVGSEITNLGIIKDGIIEETFSFPIGTSSLLRKIIGRFGTIYEDALASVKMHNEETSIVSVKCKIQKEIDDLEEEWVSSLRHIFDKISGHYLIPERFFLFCDKDFRLIFSSFLKKMRIKNMLSQNAEQKVEILDHNFFSSYCKNKCNDTLESGIIMDSIFANKIF